MKTMTKEFAAASVQISLLAALVLGSSACSHPLKVKNLDLYSVPIRLSSFENPPNVGILPYTGQPDGLFYFNTLVERINASPTVNEVHTYYIPKRSAGGFQPDLILSINPKVNYRSSGWNFLINWPGFLIFTPSWNGYVYHADIVTQFVIHDGKSNVLSESQIPISYSIRQAAMNRTIFTGLTWLEVSALALFGGIYNANVFDRNIIGPLQTHIKDNYGNYISNQFQPKVQAAADAIRTLPHVGAGSPERPGMEEEAPPSEE